MKKTINIIFIIFIFLQESIYACSCKGAVDYAEKINAIEKKGKIPDYRLRTYVFQCTGIVDKVKHLDELDKDLLYMKASSYTREKFESSQTKTANPQKFSDFITKENINKLFHVMHEIYSRPLTQTK